MESIKEKFLEILQEKYQSGTNSTLYSFELVQEIFQIQLDNQFEENELERQNITRKEIQSILDNNM